MLYCTECYFDDKHDHSTMKIEMGCKYEKMAWETIIMKIRESYTVYAEECDEFAGKLVQMHKIAKDKNIQIDNDPD